MSDQNLQSVEQAFQPVSNVPSGQRSPTCENSCSAEPVGTLLLRVADCLTALLQGPTTKAGLNESRYKVLDAVRRRPAGSCSQTELAARLLQSESNLSTLLDRMHKHGLISRERSASDRRKTIITLTREGCEVLARADQARARATAELLRALDERHNSAIGAALKLLLRKFECELGVGNWRTGAPEATRPPGSGRNGGESELEVAA